MEKTHDRVSCVQRLLNVRGEGWALDTTDALAVAICHLTMRRLKLLARR